MYVHPKPQGQICYNISLWDTVYQLCTRDAVNSSIYMFWTDEGARYGAHISHSRVRPRPPPRPLCYYTRGLVKKIEREHPVVNMMLAPALPSLLSNK